MRKTAYSTCAFVLLKHIEMTMKKSATFSFLPNRERKFHSGRSPLSDTLQVGHSFTGKEAADTSPLDLVSRVAIWEVLLQRRRRKWQKKCNFLTKIRSFGLENLKVKKEQSHSWPLSYPRFCCSFHFCYTSTSERLKTH